MKRKSNRKYRFAITPNLIAKPFPEPLSVIPFHSESAGIRRVVLMNSKQVAGAPVSIAAHFVSPEISPQNEATWRYTRPHRHRFDELNVILSESGTLVYQIALDGKLYKVKAPAAVLVPAGVLHQAEVLAGQGTFLCITLAGGKRRRRRPSSKALRGITKKNP